YDKHHLFSIGEEHKVYTPGLDHLTIMVKGWRIRPFICYDIRFPLWTRNTKPHYDVSIFIANWPAKRAHHWKSLLTARAIENQCYVMGINRIGIDGNKIPYQGDSMAIDPQGQPIVAAGSSYEIITHSFSYVCLKNWRVQFPALEDADPFLIQKNEQVQFV
ncbi:C-N hydrolase family amidase, partial [Candidatus Magnetomorum sp. HK-1]